MSDKSYNRKAARIISDTTDQMLGSIQRKRKLNPDTIRLLEEGATLGFNRTQLASHSSLSRNTLHRYLRQFPVFADYLDSLKCGPGMSAKTLIFNQIKRGDVKLAMWYLEKRDPEYSRNIKVRAKNQRDECRGVVITYKSQGGI